MPAASPGSQDAAPWWKFADYPRALYVLLCANLAILFAILGYFGTVLVLALTAAGCGDSHYVYGEAFWNGPRVELTPDELSPVIRYGEDGGVVEDIDAWLRDAGIRRVRER